MKHFLLAFMLVGAPTIGFADEIVNGDSDSTPPSETTWPEITFESSADGTDRNILPDTEVTLRIVLPAEATNYTWQWGKGSFGTDTTYTFRAYGQDNISSPIDKQLQITINGQAGAVKTYTILFHIWPHPAETENSMIKIIDKTNPQNTTLRYIREGNAVGLQQPIMTGGFDTGWIYQWKINGKDIDSQHPTIPSGLNYKNGFLETFIVCTAKNKCKDSVWFTKDYTLPITVYQCPEIPSSFILKGNGTTGTYIIKDYQEYMGDLVVADFNLGTNTLEVPTIINSTSILQTDNGYWWFRSDRKESQGRRLCLYAERNYGDTIKITSQLLELGSTTQRAWDGSTYPVLKPEPASDETENDDTSGDNGEEPEKQQENDGLPSSSRVVTIFSVNGGQTRRLTEGLNIVRMDDGSTRKVVKK